MDTIIVSIVGAIVVALPLVVALVIYVTRAIKEKNWSNLIGLVVSLIEEAEVRFNEGATRKEWVMAIVKASADTINYSITDEELSALIDSLVEMTKVVNVKK